MRRYARRRWGREKTAFSSTIGWDAGGAAAAIAIVGAALAVAAWFGAPPTYFAPVAAGAAALGLMALGLFGARWRLDGFMTGGGVGGPSATALAIGVAALAPALSALSLAAFLDGGSPVAATLSVASVLVGALFGLVIGAAFLTASFRAAGAATAPEFFAARYGGGAPRLLAALTALSALFLMLAGGLAAATLVVAAMAPDLDPALARTIAAIAVIGGAAATGIAGENRVVAAAAAGGSLAAAIGLTWASLEAAQTPFPPIAGAALATLPGALDGDLDANHAVAAGLTALSIAFATAAAPAIMGRASSAPLLRTVRRGAIWTSLVIALLAFFAPLLAVGRAEIDADGSDFLTASITTIGEIGVFATSPSAAAALYAFLTIGAVAALIAIAVSLSVSAAAIVSHDLYEPFVTPGADRSARLLTAQIAVVVLVAGAAWAAPTSLIEAGRWAGWGASLLAAGLFAPLALGVWQARATATSAITGALVGLIVAGGYIIGVETRPDWWVALHGGDGETATLWLGAPSIAAGAFGVAASLVVMTAIGLLSGRPQRETLDYLDALRGPGLTPGADPKGS